MFWRWNFGSNRLLVAFATRTKKSWFHSDVLSFWCFDLSCSDISVPVSNLLIIHELLTVWFTINLLYMRSVCVGRMMYCWPILLWVTFLIIESLKLESRFRTKFRTVSKLALTDCFGIQNQMFIEIFVYCKGLISQPHVIGLPDFDFHYSSLCSQQEMTCCFAACLYIPTFVRMMQHRYICGLFVCRICLVAFSETSLYGSF